MKTWSLLFILLSLGHTALAGIKILERGVFPEQKAVAVIDVDPANPLISILVVKGGSSSSKADYVILAKPGQTTIEQEISFKSGPGHYGVHLAMQKDRSSPYIKMGSAGYFLGLRSSSSAVSDSNVKIAGLSYSEKPWLYIQVLKEGSTFQSADQLLQTNGRDWQTSIYLRQGVGNYKIRVFATADVELPVNEFAFIGEVPVSNGDSTPFLELMPSASVQSDHPKIEELAKNIVGDTTNQMELVRKVHDWVATNVTYDLDLYRRTMTPDKQLFFVDALSVLERKASICEGYSQLTAALLRSLKIPTRIIHGMTKMGIHSWNEVMIDNVWYPMDVTWDAGTADMAANNGLGVYEPKLRHIYFLPEAKKFAEDHQKQTVSPN